MQIIVIASFQKYGKEQIFGRSCYQRAKNIKISMLMQTKVTPYKNTIVLYIHGKGGNAEEAEHYKCLFPGCEVYGLDYRTFTPWETGAEIKSEVESLKKKYENIILIANSIGAFFSMNAQIDGDISKAYFISPVVNEEQMAFLDQWVESNNS